MLCGEPRGQTARYLARIAQMATIKVDSINSSPGCWGGILPPIDEDRIAALIDALKRHPRMRRAGLGPLIRRELASAPMRDRLALLDYFEQWCTQQFEILLEESLPATDMIQ
jgi:hypothetical protein